MIAFGPVFLLALWTAGLGTSHTGKGFTNPGNLRDFGSATNGPFQSSDILRKGTSCVDGLPFGDYPSFCFWNWFYPQTHPNLRVCYRYRLGSS